MSSDEISIDSRYLQTCDIPAADIKVEAFTLVIFGGAGDLSQRKLMPSLYNLFTEDELPEAFSILAFDRLDLDDKGYRLLMEQAVKSAFQSPIDENKWETFSRRLSYFQFRFERDGDFEGLRERIDQITVRTSKGTRAVIYYMAVPPQVVPLAVERLKAHDLSKGLYATKIVIEKPFGEDRKSAGELEQDPHRRLRRESDIPDRPLSRQRTCG